MSSDSAKTTLIKQLVRLQTVDTARYVIQAQRGDLPRVITQAKTEIGALEAEKNTYSTQIATYDQEILDQQAKRKNAKQLIKKYETDQKEAKNDQEYDTLAKEIELAKLDVLLAQKKIKEHHYSMAKEEARLEEVQGEIDTKRQLLAQKQEALDKINKLNQAQEKELEKQRNQAMAVITDLDLYHCYENIRQYKQEAVVNVVKDACNGCFMVVPAQLQIKIKEGNQIFHCENCGRILADVEEPEVVPVQKKTKRTRRKVR